MTHQPADPPHQRFLIVSGPGGAGRTTALNALEDLGVEVIDNLPMSLLPHLVDGPTPARPVAIGIDTRNRDFSAGHLVAMTDRLSGRPDLDVQLLYMDAREDVLVRRYSETRRRHPMTSSTPREGIRREIDLLAPVRDRADFLIDSSDMTVHETRAQIDRWFAPGKGRFLSVQVESFSYKRGLPRGLDMAFDVRFLRNPHWVPELRPMNGTAPEVAAYVAGDPRYGAFFDQVSALLQMLLPAYKDEGKSYLTIGFGCSGGKHRSVATTEAMASALAQAGWPVSIRHREIERSAIARGVAGEKERSS